MKTWIRGSTGLLLWAVFAGSAQAQSVFNPETRIAAGGFPVSLTAADLDGDTLGDVVLADFLRDSVSVFLATGAASFGPQVTHAVGHRPRDVAAADFDGDGDVDLVALHDLDRTLDVLLNDGTSGMGLYATIPSSPAGGNEPKRVAVGDLDADGLVDLIVLVPGPLGQASRIYRLDNLGGVGLGWQGFGPPVELPILVTFGFVSGLADIAVADVTGDGFDDVVASRQGFFFISAGSHVYTFEGDGAGGILPPVQNFIGNGAGPLRISLGDVDGDGDPDLATANDFSGDVTVLRNFGVDAAGDWIGFGNYLLSPPFPFEYAAAGAQDVQWIDDINGDGLLDLLVVEEGRNEVSILYTDPVRGFLYGGHAPVGTNPLDVALVDGAAITANSGSSDLSVLALADLPLAASGAGNIGVTGGGPLELLEINGGSGGADRVVTVAVGQPITFSLDYPVTNTSGTAPFAIWGKFGTPSPSDLLVVPNIGAISFAPCRFGTSGFTLADNIDLPICPPILASTPSTPGSPWSFMLPNGLSRPTVITFQGAAFGLDSTLQITNAVILVVQ